MMKRALLIVLAVLGAFAQAQDTFTLKRVPKKDEEAVYLSILDIDMQGQKVSLFSTLTEKVVWADDKGVYIVETKYSNTHRSTKDGDTEFTIEPDVMTFAPTGEVLAIRGKATSSLYRGANLLGMFLPDSPIKKDETWKKEIKADKKLGTVDLSAEFKLVGTEKVGSFDCVILNATVKETAGENPASAEQIIWLNIADSTLVKRTVTFKNLPTGSKSQALVSAKLVITRAEAKEEAKPDAK